MCRACSCPAHPIEHVTSPDVPLERARASACKPRADRNIHNNRNIQNTGHNRLPDC
jgi:hypothetical protein